MTDATIVDDEPVHTWFELTYANYLVLPRSVLQSMPAWWQRRFVEMLEQLHGAYGQLDWPDYEVEAVDRVAFSDLTEVERLAAGYTVEPADPDDEDALDQWYSPDGDEVDHCHDTFARPRRDPIPHYNRGRTRIPLPDGGTLPPYRPTIEYELTEELGQLPQCRLLVDGVVRFSGHGEHP